MRAAITASIFIAAAATVVPGAAQARGIFGCDADGKKQEGGAAIGAIIGGSAGAGTVVLQGKDDLDLKKGSTMTVQSTSPRQ